MEKRTSQRQTLIIICLIALIIILLLIFIDFSAVIEIIQTVDWTIMAMATAILVLGYLFLNLRWRYLLGNRHDYQDLLQVTGSSYMFAILMQLPTSLYRLLVMDRKAIARATETSSAIVVEVMLNMILRLIGVALVVSLLGARSKQSDIPLLVSLIFVVGLILLMFLLIGLRERLQPRAANVLSRLPKVDEQRANNTAASLFRAVSNAGSPKRFGIALFLSMCYWLCGFGFYFLAVSAFPSDESFQIPAIAATAMVVVPTSTPMMIGIFHGVLIAALVALKLAGTTEATSYAIIVHLVQMVVLVIVGSWGLKQLKLNPREIVRDVRNHVGKATDTPEG